MLTWEPMPGRPRGRISTIGSILFRVSEYHGGLYMAARFDNGQQTAIYMPNAVQRIDGDACREAAMAWCERSAAASLRAQAGARV